MLKIKWSTKSLEFGTLKEQFKQGNCPIHIPFLGQGRQKTMVKFETFWGEDAITTLNNYADFNEERIFKISDNQIRMDLAALDPRLKPHTLRKVFTQTMKRSLSTLLTNRGQADASGLSDAIVEYWCTPPETLLLKNNYVDSIGTSKINDGVLTDLGEYSSITKTYARHYDGEMIYISPYFASTLALTPNHEIRSIKTVKCSFRHNKVCSPNCYEKTKIKYCKKPWTSYKPDWIPAEKLTLNDLVLLRIPIEVNNVKTLRISDLVKGTFVKNNCIFMAENRYGRIANNPNAQNLQNNIHLTPDFMRLVGYYLAEGSIGSKNRTLSFSFNTKEEKYAKDVNSILSEMGLTTKTLDRSKEGKDELRVSVNCKPLSLLFKKLFGNKAEKKHIPHLFMSLPDNKVLELLKGLFRGDGSLGRKNRLEFKTTSRNMAYQIWLLLIRLNYIGTVKESSPRESRIQGRAVIGKKAYRVYLTDPKLAFLIFGTSEKTDRRVRKLAYTANNYLCMRLRRIERRHYTGIVCNLRMQNHPSYTTISATVHNCGHSLGKVRAAYNIPSIKTQIEMYREAYPRIKLKVR